MYAEKAGMIIQEVKRAVIGKDDCIYKVMMAMLAGGHILLEDIPGVGKTTMALAFSKACALQQNRVQFTPDVLPSDIQAPLCATFSLQMKSTVPPPKPSRRFWRLWRRDT